MRAAVSRRAAGNDCWDRVDLGFAPFFLHGPRKNTTGFDRRYKEVHAGTVGLARSYSSVNITTVRHPLDNPSASTAWYYTSFFSTSAMGEPLLPPPRGLSPGSLTPGLRGSVDAGLALAEPGNVLREMTAD